MAKILPIHKTIPHIHNLRPQPNKSPKQHSNSTRPPKYSTKNLQYTQKYPPETTPNSPTHGNEHPQWTSPLKQPPSYPYQMHIITPTFPNLTHNNTCTQMAPSFPHKNSIGNIKLHLPYPRCIMAKCTSLNPKCLSLSVKFK